MPDGQDRAARWYRRLLLLFPFEFRRDYGAEMSGVFAEQLEDSASGGFMSRLRLWLDTLAGALRVGPRRHLSIFWQDARYAVRTLRGAPVFTVAAVLALGFGVGANAAVFGLVNAVLLNPTPVEDPSRIAALQVYEPKENRYTSISTDNFHDIRTRQRSFEQLAAFSFTGVTLQDRGEPQDLFAMVVSGTYFELLGVQPVLGRAIRPDEDRNQDADPVVVLSHRLWSRSFGEDPGIIGQAIRLNGQALTVVGVAPESFRGTFGFAEPHMYVPLGLHGRLAPNAPWTTGRLWRWLNVLGRLAPGATLESANAELAVMGDRLAEEFPQFNRGRTLAALPLNRFVIGPNEYDMYVRAGWLLTAIVAVVLLVACVNLANLMLVRATARARDLALRVALGASRLRIIRQLLTESLGLGLAGGTLGLVLAHWTHQALWAMRPANLEQPGLSVGLDATVLGYTLVVSVLASLFFGLAPALQIWHTDVNQVLNEGGRQPGLGRGRARTALVVAEVAMAVVAVVAAGLFLRGLQQAQQIDPGFDTESLIAMTYTLPGRDYEPARAKLVHQQLLEELAAQPQIRAAAVADRGLLSQGNANTITVVGQEPPPDALGFLVDTAMVTPDYFETVGIPVLEGRAFTAADRPETRPVAIINEAMARQFWPDGNAVGQQFGSRAATRTMEVVGVVRDAKYETLGESAQPFFYRPLLQADPAGAGPTTLLLSAHGDPAAAVPAARAALKQIAPAVPLDNVTTMDELLGQALWAPRTIAALVSAFGALALLLATIGVYSVMAYTVTQRTQEIGLRMALGATPRGILAMFIGRGMRLTIAGIVAGGLLTLLVAGAAQSLLYGVSPRDPLTFAVVAAALAAVTLLACYGPARRAAKMDPAPTLRG